jgi:hypothetical protein
MHSAKLIILIGKACGIVRVLSSALRGDGKIQALVRGLEGPEDDINEKGNRRIALIPRKYVANL